MCAVQYKELEGRLNALKEAVAAAGQEADQQGQAILGLEANVATADEQRRNLKKQLVEVSIVHCIYTLSKLRRVGEDPAWWLAL